MVAAAPGPTGAAEVTGWLRATAEELPSAARASRLALLGRRNPNGPSLVTYYTVEQIIKMVVPKIKHFDSSGGPGSRLYQLLNWEDNSAKPLADYAWMQGTLRRELEQINAESAAASARLAGLVVTTERLAAWLGEQKSWPAGLEAPQYERFEQWPDYCLTKLAEAVEKRRLGDAQHWSQELAAAVFALADLHRWTILVADDTLAALDFQKLCRVSFVEVEDRYAPARSGPLTEQPLAKEDKVAGLDRYSPRQCRSLFAGGAACQMAINNLVEVERQAQELFASPQAWAEAAGEKAEPNPAAVWLPPTVRAAFGQLRKHLSPGRQGVWDLAAARPYERSFLANHLFRLQTAGVLEQVGVALERYDQSHPQNSAAAPVAGDRTREVDELMDVLVYRAGLGLAGMAWADRFDARLMAAGGKITADDGPAALRQANKFEYGVYGGNDHFQGFVTTLAQALATHRLDCIRGTDLIGAVYRNAGRTGFMHIRWCRGTSGHSIAAVADTIAGKRTIVTQDSLFPPDQEPGRWPGDYFQSRPDLYAAELFGRGLDNMVFLQGYVVRGPDAGTLVTTAVPYLPDWTTPGSAKVFSGPYPGPTEKKN